MTLTKTLIETFDYTWSPVSGCLHGCPYCFARKRAENRFYKKAFPNRFKPTFYPERLQDPTKKKQHQTIFVVSMGDLFGEWVKLDWLVKVFLAIESAPQHTYCLLTKNPQRMKSWCHQQKNIYWGTSVTGLMDTDRIRQLKELNTDKKFISFEPLLANPGNINLDGISSVIIGAHTKPTLQPDIRWIFKILEEADRTKTKVFCKDSLSYLNVSEENKYFKRELPWKLNKDLWDYGHF